LGGPLLNLLGRALGVSVVVVVVLVVLVQPALVLALQFVVEDNALDAGAALVQAPLSAFVGAVDLQAALAFARADEARVESLRTFWGRVSMALQQVVTGLGQGHRMIAVARHA